MYSKGTIRETREKNLRGAVQLYEIQFYPSLFRIEMPMGVYLYWESNAEL